MSPRLPPTISFKDNWMKELNSEVPTNPTKTKNPIIKNGETRGCTTVQFTQEIEKDVLFGREGTEHSTRTGRPVNGPKSIQSCVSMPVELVDKIRRQRRRRRRRSNKNGETREELDIDFRVPGLSHAVLKEADNFRVQGLVKKIEGHPHREALQADLQQNNVYHPFSNNSKAMIRELDNVELFALCETIPKVQCSFSMSSQLESRNFPLHLRTIPG